MEAGMEFEIVLMSIVAIAILLFIKSKWDEKEQLIKLQKQNKKNWGKISSEEYTRDKLDIIKKYFLEYQTPYDIDDITWNDMDMDTIYMLINQTKSTMGQDYLYRMLRQIQTEPTQLEEREKLIQFFQNNEEARNQLLTEFHFMGKVKGISLYRYLNLVHEIPKHNPLDSFVMLGLLAMSVGLIGLSVVNILPPIYGVVLLVCMIINNVIRYFNRKARIEKYFQVFMYIIRMLQGADSLVKLQIKELQPYFDEIKAILDTFKDLQKGSFLVFFDSRKGSGSFWDLTLDYVRMITHVDLIKFDFMVKKVQNRKEELNQLYEKLGRLDALLSVASFRAYLGEDGYCIPQLHQTTKAFLRIEDGYHSMLQNPVMNSIDAKKPVLITGSNASGKSTFIKMVALNAILSQTIHTAVAKDYEASYFHIYSSMALRDDLQGNESYYVVEIKSIQRILEQTKQNIPVLVFVDEILRGTNTLERIAASSQILKSFAQTNALVFAATHDLELTHILEKYYDNYHFQEEIKDNQVVFDYVLQNGRAYTRNAIKLLAMLGYEKTIIKKAEKSANSFLEKGVWNQI